jgi:hypothetical protein
MVVERVSHRLVNEETSSYWSVTTLGDRHAFSEAVAERMRGHVNTLFTWNRSDFEKRNAKLPEEFKTKVWFNPEGEIKEIRVAGLKVKQVTDKHIEAAKALVKTAKEEQKVQEFRSRRSLGSLWPNFNSPSNRSGSAKKVRIAHDENFNNNNEFEEDYRSNGKVDRRPRPNTQVSNLIKENKQLREQLKTTRDQVGIWMNANKTSLGVAKFWQEKVEHQHKLATQESKRLEKQANTYLKAALAQQKINLHNAKENQRLREGQREVSGLPLGGNEIELEVQEQELADLKVRLSEAQKESHRLVEELDAQRLLFEKQINAVDALYDKRMEKLDEGERALIEERVALAGVQSQNKKIEQLRKDVQGLEQSHAYALELATKETRARQNYAALLKKEEKDHKALKLSYQELVQEGEKLKEKIRVLQGENNLLRPDAKEVLEWKRAAQEANEWVLRLQQNIFELRDEIEQLKDK